MQILPPIKTYTLRSGRNCIPIQPPIKPTQTNNTTNGEKNGEKSGNKENVTPGKPAEVVTQRKKVVKPVRDSKVLSKPVQQSVAIVSQKRKAKPVTEDYGASIAKVKTQKRKGIVPTADVISNVKTASASKNIKKPALALVPSAVIPSISDYDDDDSQFSQLLDAEENAYRQQLVATQKSGKGKGKGKVKKDLPEGVTIFCTKCHEVFDNADQLSVHEKKCFIGRCYPCPYAGCSHVNSQNSLLDEHIEGVHENNPFRCELCPQKVFIYKKSYNKNFKRYYESGPENRAKFKYLCEDCDFVLDDRTEYQTHVDRHRNIKRYIFHSVATYKSFKE